MRTYEEIGKILGISKQRVQEIERAALRKLRDTRFNKLLYQLKDYHMYDDYDKSIEHFETPKY